MQAMATHFEEVHSHSPIVRACEVVHVATCVRAGSEQPLPGDPRGSGGVVGSVLSCTALASTTSLSRLNRSSLSPGGTAICDLLSTSVLSSAAAADAPVVP